MRAEFAGRPALVAAFGFVLGLLVRDSWACGAILTLGCLVLATHPLRWLLLASAMLGVWRAPLLQVTPVLEHADFRGIVDVVSVPESSGDREVALVRGANARYRLQFPQGFDINLGDRLDVSGTLIPLSEGAFSYWTARGVIGSIRPIGKPKVLEKGAWIWRLGRQVRLSFVQSMDGHLGQRESTIADALCFNQDRELDDKVRDNLVRSGLIHVVSTSGFHVYIVAMGLAFVLRLMPVPYWSQLVVLGSFLAVYAAATGMHPPMVRACIVAILMSAPYLWRKPPDALSAIAIAALVSLWYDPTVVRTPSFQLSFITFAGLVLYAGRQYMEPMSLLSVTIKNPICVGGIASIASAPILAGSFGYLSLVAPMTNAAATFLVPLIVWFALLGWMLGPLGGGIINWLVEPWCRVLEWLATSVGQLPWAAIYFRPIPTLVVGGLYLLLLSTWRQTRVEP